MPKIALSMCDNLGKSYSEYESQPLRFVTVRANIVEVSGRRNKKNKKKKKNQKKKTSAETIRHLVLRTGCLKTHEHRSFVINIILASLTFSVYITCLKIWLKLFKRYQPLHPDNIYPSDIIPAPDKELWKYVLRSEPQTRLFLPTVTVIIPRHASRYKHKLYWKHHSGPYNWLRTQLRHRDRR